ncbi:dnaJ homolog subfamily C member 27-like isoform X1 [Dreissena polymorpha]|uniref:dnaJ homolog subfamily C member 27-like isoform X1 n=2 Tax=Dreissena polymorpha TaxID=45954 RepID=UPI002264D0B5|nr:dnaJ homolog subfamily C member 27-like isoform X1 [Dreissena polymorpha]
MDRQRGHLAKNPHELVDKLTWIKIVGIGNAGVGKTCLIKHFCESKFSGGYQPTVGVDYGFKIQNVKGCELRVHLWDLSGSPEYIDVRNELYGQTDAIFLVFDVTNQASFESLDTWLKEVTKYSSGVHEIVLVANKVDTKAGKRLISTQDAKKWAQSHKMNIYEASAATGDGVLKLFDEMLNNIINKRRQAGILTSWPGDHAQL